MNYELWIKEREQVTKSKDEERTEWKIEKNRKNKKKREKIR